jgi:heme oxygenase
MTIPTSPPIEVMTRLRQYTSEAHKSLEELPFSKALMAKTLPLSSYIGQLEAYLLVQRTLEKRCQSNLDFPAIQAVWQADLIKTVWLKADLAYFKYTEIPNTSVQRAILAVLRFVEQEKPYELLGTLYVMEGSMLGSRVLLPYLQAAYSLQEQGVRYYHGYGEDTQNHWQAFKLRMNAAITEVVSQTQAIEGAMQTFVQVKSLLTALWQGR